MSRYTLKNQPLIHGYEQILTPDEIDTGMHIGMLGVFEPYPIRERAMQSLAAFAISYGRENNESRRAAAKRAWHFKGPDGLLPQWHGMVHAKSHNGVWVNLIGSLVEEEKPFDYTNQDFNSLPVVPQPLRQHDTFESMGLVAISSSGSPFGSEAGQWLPAAAVRLP